MVIEVVDSNTSIVCPTFSYQHTAPGSATMRVTPEPWLEGNTYSHVSPLGRATSLVGCNPMLGRLFARHWKLPARTTSWSTGHRAIVG